MRRKRSTSHFIGVMQSQRRRNLLKSAFYCWMHFTFDSLLITNAKSQSELLDAKVMFVASSNLFNFSNEEFASRFNFLFQ